MVGDPKVQTSGCEHMAPRAVVSRLHQQLLEKHAFPQQVPPWPPSGQLMRVARATMQQLVMKHFTWSGLCFSSLNPTP